MIQWKKEQNQNLILIELLDLLIVNLNKRYLYYLIYVVKIMVMIILINLMMLIKKIYQKNHQKQKIKIRVKDQFII